MNEMTFLTKLSEILSVPLDQLSDATEIDPTNGDSIQSLTACKSLGELRNLIRSAAK